MQVLLGNGFESNSLVNEVEGEENVPPKGEASMQLRGRQADCRAFSANS